VGHMRQRDWDGRARWGSYMPKKACFFRSVAFLGSRIPKETGFTIITGIYQGKVTASKSRDGAKWLELFGFNAGRSPQNSTKTRNTFGPLTAQRASDRQRRQEKLAEINRS